MRPRTDTQTDRQTHRHTDTQARVATIHFASSTTHAKCNKQRNKPVSFYGPIAPPVPNAPSSRICGQNPRNDADAIFLDPHISVVDCCCSAGTVPVLTEHATIGGRLPELQTLKCISSVSFVRIESIFLQCTGDTDAKMMEQNF